VQLKLAHTTLKSHLRVLQQVLCSLRDPLKQLNRHKFADIYTQQAKARNELSLAQTLLQQHPLNNEL